MPVFGVGPLYVLTCLVLTVVGLALHLKGLLAFGECKEVKVLFMVLGVAFIVFGVYLWVKSVIVQKISQKILEGKLITTGVYGIVRNPIYSAFLFLFTGVLCLAANYALLILPVIYWIFLTVLMKCTEERWLLEEFGEEYATYCRQVNRVIPWFRKKN